MSGTTYGSTGLTHDAGLYDPALHDNQIVALYETDAQARAAKDVLVHAGFPASSMQILDRDSVTGTTATGTDEGFWGAIKSLFVPDEDRTSYSTAISHGHAMLVVTPDSTMDRQHLITLLESTNPLDFDSKLEEWRTTSTTTATTAGLATGVATGAMATGYKAPVVATGLAGTDTIKVMEESLRVGKREVAAGAVRIRSYIVERPVEEQVSLHEERINIERHAVDRPATAADFGAFQERTIEARATAEEAVIQKDARVVEEIGLNKTATDRVETIRDTVRKTEVEIEGAETLNKKVAATTTTTSTTSGTTSR